MDRVRQLQQARQRFIREFSAGVESIAPCSMSVGITQSGLEIGLLVRVSSEKALASDHKAQIRAYLPPTYMGSHETYNVSVLFGRTSRAAAHQP